MNNKWKKISILSVLVTIATSIFLVIYFGTNKSNSNKSNHNATSNKSTNKNESIYWKELEEAMTFKKLDELRGITSYQTEDEIKIEDERIINKYKSRYNLQDAFDKFDYSMDNIYDSDYVKGLKVDVDNNNYLIHLAGGPKFFHSDKGEDLFLDFVASSGIKDSLNKKQIKELKVKFDKRFHEEISFTTKKIPSGIRTWNSDAWELVQSNNYNPKKYQNLNHWPTLLYMNQPQTMLMRDFMYHSYTPKQIHEIAILTLAILHKKVQALKQANKKVILDGSSYGSEILLAYLSRYKADADQFYLNAFVFTSQMGIMRGTKDIFGELFYKEYLAKDFVKWKNKNSISGWMEAINKINYLNRTLLLNEMNQLALFNVLKNRDHFNNKVYIQIGAEDDFWKNTREFWDFNPGNSKLARDFFVDHVLKVNGVNTFIFKNAEHGFFPGTLGYVDPKAPGGPWFTLVKNKIRTRMLDSISMVFYFVWIKEAESDQMDYWILTDK